MRVLLIGYGNASRRDDGVALHVLNRLRESWGRPALTAADDGWDELGGTRDTLFLQQLTPELAATVAQYDRVIFLDAALPAAEEAVRVERVASGYRLAAISHHLEPGALLALSERLYGKTPEGYLVSVRGADFDFGEELSPETAEAVPVAAQRVQALIAGWE